MNTSLATRPRARLASAVGLLLALAIASAGPAWSAGSHVRPPAARPHGVSLTEMAAAVAPFTLNDNDPADYPDTPVQILYITGVDEWQEVDGGVIATANDSFTVAPGTTLYVPLFNLTDIPPALGGFPSTPAEAVPYFFDPAQYGGDFEIVVDGVATPIGAEYLVGPITDEGSGTQILTLGAFVGPLSVGTHTVTVNGGIYGEGVAEVHGVSFIEEHLIYTVTVATAG